MAKGNPFGNKGGEWMANAKLRAMYRAGRTLSEIAEANERATGWKPHRSVVKRKMEALGEEPRATDHSELNPWRGKVKPEHNNSVYRHMLQAEGRRRAHKALSDSDKRLISLMNDTLFGRGTPLVIGYHPEVGFYTIPREDWDEDLIRNPRTDHYSNPGLNGGRTGRKPGRAELRAASDGGADAQTRASGT